MGERAELSLSLERRAGVVRAPHLASDRLAQPLGQLVQDVSQLVQLTAPNHRLVEALEHRAAERQRTVDDHEDRPAHVESSALVTELHEQVAHERGAFGRPLFEREGMLGPGAVDAKRHDAAVLGGWTPSTISATRSSSASSSASACSVACTNLRETAERLVAAALPVTAPPTGSSPTW